MLQTCQEGTSRISKNIKLLLGFNVILIKILFSFSFFSRGQTKAQECI